MWWKQFELGVSELPSSIQEQNLGGLIDSSMETLAQHSVAAKEENRVGNYKERSKNRKFNIMPLSIVVMAMFWILTAQISLYFKNGVLEKAKKIANMIKSMKIRGKEQRLGHFSLEEKTTGKYEKDCEEYGWVMAAQPFLQGNGKAPIRRSGKQFCNRPREALLHEMRS